MESKSRMDTEKPQNTIVLDTTFEELYALDGGPRDQEIVLVYALPTADIQMTAGVPISSRFVYQSPLFEGPNSDVLARLFLQVTPQLLGFAAGNLPLVLFDLDAHDQERIDSERPAGFQRPHQSDAYRVFQGLSPSQRPQLSFVGKSEEVSLSPGARIAIMSPMDCLLNLPHDVDPDMHYEILSKRALAFSSLPTPPTTVIDTLLHPHQTRDSELVQTETTRMLQPISSRPPPFVIKMPQAYSGQRNFMIRTDADRSRALHVLETELKRMLRRLAENNEHLRPCSLIVQDMLHSKTASLSFFVTRTGRAIFLSHTEQILDDDSQRWSGSHISYPEQDRSKALYTPIIDQISRFVFEKARYSGPISADIMRDADGRFVVVDVNTRASGSHPLGVLRRHFSTERGLQEAVLLFPVHLRGRREEAFEEVFGERVREGRVVVCGWCHDREGVNSWCCLVLGAEDKERLHAFVDEVDKFKVKE
ncbi:MAG: hypothetical protein Q9219_007463 [cf. Caloplaca sp. 3 TL-2023]